MKLRFVIVGICCFNLFGSSAYAQSASVVLVSQDNDFRVSINHILQNQNFTNNIKIDSLNGNSPYNISVKFKNDSTLVKTNIFLIDNGITHFYSVTKQAIELKKIVPNASYSSPPKQLTVNYLFNNQMPDTTILDSISQKDTAYIVPYATYYKLEDYKGRIACPWPIKPNKLAELKGVILAEQLEESKLEKVKIAIQDMDSMCIMMNQVKELLVLFEYEETKLDFAKFIASSLFDIDNVEKLREAFNFDNSMDVLKKYIEGK